jgi:hypothetical protein
MKITSLFYFFILLSCNSDLKIVPLSPYSKFFETDSTKEIQQYFMVKGKEYDIDKIYSHLLYFADSCRNNAVPSLNLEFSIFFYKESDKLTTAFQESESDLLIWHGDELLFFVNYTVEGKRYYQKFNEGQSIPNHKNEIEVIDVKPINH